MASSRSPGDSAEIWRVSSGTISRPAHAPVKQACWKLPSWLATKSSGRPSCFWAAWVQVRPSSVATPKSPMFSCTVRIITSSQMT